jgi:photosystem II stability/assembly factor-like uncharacterized protein
VQVVILTPKPGSFTEPSIAINPNDPQQLVAAFQVKASAAFSRDGGRNWTIADGTAPPNYKMSGDVSVAFDDRGHAFLCYIAFDKLGTENYWAHGATRNGIFVRRSPDGGKTWDQEPAIVIAHNSDPGIPFEDKPYIVADTTQSKYAGNLYVGWTQFTLTKSVLLFSRSTDSGKTWSPPVEISTQEGLPRDDNGAVEGFTGAVGPDGKLYLVWCDGAGIVLATSKDGGRRFSKSRVAIKTAASYFDPEYVFRGNGFPEIAINPRTSELFVTWADFRNGDVDIFSASSKDHGKHWSPAVRVNNDPLHNGRDQFFQWLAVDPVDGSVNVIFCDRRSDPANRDYSIVLARSTDGGRTFTNYLWSTKPSDPKDAFIGDYLGIAARGGRVYGIWARVAQPDEVPEDERKKPSGEEPGQPATAANKPAELASSENERSAPTPESQTGAEAEQKEKGQSKTETVVKAKALFIEIGLADFSGQRQ